MIPEIGTSIVGPPRGGDEDDATADVQRPEVRGEEIAADHFEYDVGTAECGGGLREVLGERVGRQVRTRPRPGSGPVRFPARGDHARQDGGFREAQTRRDGKRVAGVACGVFCVVSSRQKRANAFADVSAC